MDPKGTLTSIRQATFTDPEEGATAAIDRLVLAITLYRISPEALQSLVILTSLACHPERGGTACPEEEIRELTDSGLIRWIGREKVALV